MLHQDTLHFLTQLSQNNNKPWFEANKEPFEAAKKDFEAFITELLGNLATFEPGFREQKAKDCVFRIYRDVRFSKDKTPYKPNFGAYLSKGGKKFIGAGYYLHIEPGKSFAGGGLWMPEAPLLKAIRQEVDYNFKEFKSIIENKNFNKLFSKIEGEQLKNIPKGYEIDNPASDYLKMKSFTVMYHLNDEDLLDKNAINDCFNTFKTMKSFIDFLNKSLD